MDYKDIANIEEQTCKAEEPMLNSSILTLRRRVMERVSQTTSEDDLYECLTVLNHVDDNDYTYDELITRIENSEQQELSPSESVPHSDLMSRLRNKYAV